MSDNPKLPGKEYSRLLGEACEEQNMPNFSLTWKLRDAFKQASFVYDAAK